jgi:hypothetical protein
MYNAALRKLKNAGGGTPVKVTKRKVDAEEGEGEGTPAKTPRKKAKATPKKKKGDIAEIEGEGAVGAEGAEVGGVVDGKYGFDLASS